MNLYDIAFTLAEEIHSGNWNHLKEITQKPAPACDEIISELERRCPGHRKETYQTELAKALHDSR